MNHGEVKNLLQMRNGKDFSSHRKKDLQNDDTFGLFRRIASGSPLEIRNDQKKSFISMNQSTQMEHQMDLEFFC
ncbi:hypothetical protein BLA29_007056 [Euroglyphus maynei]|uniref:Uncharacterized protein n=1 Tax=Euroglyphus maynei TaxID=6958 RepID=A0A1Y3BM97_EURMA|nr:hypothetical protein BLA29_007056 [Euroglyphus maynei]